MMRCSVVMVVRLVSFGEVDDYCLIVTSSERGVLRMVMVVVLRDDV